MNCLFEFYLREKNEVVNERRSFGSSSKVSYICISSFKRRKKINKLTESN